MGYLSHCRQLSQVIPASPPPYSPMLFHLLQYYTFLQVPQIKCLVVRDSELVTIRRLSGKLRLRLIEPPNSRRGVILSIFYWRSVVVRMGEVDLEGFWVSFSRLQGCVLSCFTHLVFYREGHLLCRLLHDGTSHLANVAALVMKPAYIQPIIPSPWSSFQFPICILWPKSYLAFQTTKYQFCN